MKRKGKFRSCILSALLLMLMLLGTSVETKAAQSLDFDKGVVRVVALITENGEITVYWSGSAFGVGKAGKETDTFVTNAHVVLGAASDETVHDFKADNYKLYILFDDVTNEDLFMDSDGHWGISDDVALECEVLYCEGLYPDVAVIRTSEKVPGRIALPLQSANKIKRMTEVYTVGYPGSADSLHKNEDTIWPGKVGASTINPGIISTFEEMNLFGDTWIIEHTAAIDHGNSGGPLLTEKGRVIGINTYGTGGLSSDGNSISLDEQYYMSVFIDYAMDALDQLGISYDSNKFPLIPVLAAIIALVLVLLGIIVWRFRNSEKPEPAPEPLLSAYDLRIQCVAGKFNGKRFGIKEYLRIGTDPQSNNVVYPVGSNGISRRHCQFSISNNKLYIQDLGSSFGTYVNGRKITAKELIEVKLGDQIHLASEAENYLIVKSSSVS